MPDAWKLVWTYRLNGVPHAQNVTYLRPQGAFAPPTSTDATAIEDAINDTIGTSTGGLLDRMSNVWSIGFSVQSVDQPNRPVLALTTSTNANGSPDTLPRMNALVFRLTTASTFNGRIFIPGMAETQSTATGPPDATTVSSVAADLNALRDELDTSAGLDWVVYSRTLDELAAVTVIDRSQSSQVTGWQRQIRRARPLR